MAHIPMTEAHLLSSNDLLGLGSQNPYTSLYAFDHESPTELASSAWSSSPALSSVASGRDGLMMLPSSPYYTFDSSSLVPHQGYYYHTLPSFELSSSPMGQSISPTMQMTAAAAPRATPPSNPHTMTAAAAAAPKPHVPRPANAFMLFRSAFLKDGIIPYHEEHRQQNLSRVAGAVWNLMPIEEKQVWHDKAELALQEHNRKHPNYKFTPAPRGTGKTARSKARQVDPEVADKEKARLQMLRERYMPSLPKGNAKPAERRRRVKAKNETSKNDELIVVAATATASGESKSKSKSKSKVSSGGAASSSTSAPVGIRTPGVFPQPASLTQGMAVPMPFYQQPFTSYDQIALAGYRFPPIVPDMSMVAPVWNSFRETDVVSATAGVNPHDLHLSMHNECFLPVPWQNSSPNDQASFGQYPEELTSDSQILKEQVFAATPLTFPSAADDFVDELALSLTQSSPSRGEESFL